MTAINNCLNIIVGFICGILLFLLFFRKTDRHGPNAAKMSQEVLTYKNKKYKLIPKVYICPINISMKNNKQNQ